MMRHPILNQVQHEASFNNDKIYKSNHNLVLFLKSDFQIESLVKIERP